jgi:hypothetical protein
VSDATGRYEVYVTAYPGPEGRWQVSNEGAVEPIWSRNGRELFYRNSTDLMVVDVEPAETFVAGEPRLLFSGSDELTDPGSPSLSANYDVTPDGKRFLMVSRQEQGARRLNVVVNCFEELKRLAPVNSRN